MFDCMCVCTRDMHTINNAKIQSHNAIVHKSKEISHTHCILCKHYWLITGRVNSYNKWKIIKQIDQRAQQKKAAQTQIVCVWEVCKNMNLQRTLNATTPNEKFVLCISIFCSDKMTEIKYNLWLGYLLCIVPRICIAFFPVWTTI